MNALSDEEYAEYLALKGAKVDATPTDDVPAVKGKDVPMIVAYTMYVDQNGVTQRKEHGPMPVSEWADYERDHGM